MATYGIEKTLFVERRWTRCFQVLPGVLSPVERCILNLIAMHQNDRFAVYLSQADIGRCVGVTRETAGIALAKLIEHRLLVGVDRGRGFSHGYRLGEAFYGYFPKKFDIRAIRRNVQAALPRVFRRWKRQARGDYSGGVGDPLTDQVETTYMDMAMHQDPDAE